MAEKISRSTGEAYLAIVISISVVVFPVNWWVKLTLMCVVGGLAVDIAFRHPRTINCHWLKRTLVASLGILILGFVSYTPIRNQYLEDSKRIEQRPGLVGTGPPQKMEPPSEARKEEPKRDLPPNNAKRPEPAHKIPPPRSAPVPAEPAPKGPTRLGIGPEAYKDIDDAQVGKWAMEESDKIEELARAAMHPGLGSPSAAQWFFENKFNDCCAQDVKELRTEILRRLGPPSKDPDEIMAWTVLFPQSKYPSARDDVRPSSVSSYAPFLRQLGVRLKRRQIPRAAPKVLHFSEKQVAPDQLNMPYNIVVSVQTQTTISAGYIIVEFDGHPGRIQCDLADSKSMLGGSDVKMIENEDVREYARRYEPPNFAIVIGKTPFTPEKPVRVLASGGSVPFHVVKVTLFDE